VKCRPTPADRLGRGRLPTAAPTPFAARLQSMIAPIVVGRDAR
jgi:hypothetical protein